MSYAASTELTNWWKSGGVPVVEPTTGLLDAKAIARWVQQYADAVVAPIPPLPPIIWATSIEGSWETDMDEAADVEQSEQSEQFVMLRVPRELFETAHAFPEHMHQALDQIVHQRRALTSFQWMDAFTKNQGRWERMLQALLRCQWTEGTSTRPVDPRPIGTLTLKSVWDLAATYTGSSLDEVLYVIEALSQMQQRDVNEVAKEMLDRHRAQDAPSQDGW